MELDDLSRLMTGEPAVSAPGAPAVSAGAAAGGGLVSPGEEVRRVARPAGPVPTVPSGVPSAPSVPLVFTSGQTVPSLPVQSGATHQLILLQPAPNGGPRLPQPAQQQQQQHQQQLSPPQQQQQQQPTQPMRQYRLPAASPAGRVTLQPPAAHGDRH